MSFSSIIGNNRAIETLKKAILQERVPHAYLFIGREGVGKKLTALSLAKALNCQKTEENNGDACGKCISCKKTDAMNHPDVLLVEPEGRFIKIEQIRRLQRRLQFKAVEGRYKVCIIDGADNMNIASANALLKTLEEPPSNTVLVLVAPYDTNLPATILSRCRRLTFTPLNTEELGLWLKENSNTDEETAKLLALFGGGSVSKMLDLNKNFIIDTRKKIIQRLSDVISSGGDRVLDWAQEFAKSEDINEHIEMLKVWLRDLMVKKSIQSSGYIINHDLEARLEEDSKRFTLFRLFDIWDRVNLCQNALDFNANKQIALEFMFMEQGDCDTWRRRQ